MTVPIHPDRAGQNLGGLVFSIPKSTKENTKKGSENSPHFTFGEYRLNIAPPSRSNIGPVSLYN